MLQACRWPGEDVQQRYRVKQPSWSSCGLALKMNGSSWASNRGLPSRVKMVGCKGHIWGGATQWLLDQPFRAIICSLTPIYSWGVCGLSCWMDYCWQPGKCCTCHFSTTLNLSCSPLMSLNHISSENLYWCCVQNKWTKTSLITLPLVTHTWKVGDKYFVKLKSQLQVS